MFAKEKERVSLPWAGVWEGERGKSLGEGEGGDAREEGRG